ncbi:uncharacterized protein H6S33_007114 [Morchella sextelata]|uniref:uncharacterized protein n=1 Tax=Morchella sextelata TaxID=1174677 RepID=UPI001D05A337|nr:uncharacterized protein H6S33_007114 [Morchella sextelata]KAH0604083.1 hypothetical protein H6S33_007114 [Morchella sextelata]
MGLLFSTLHPAVKTVQRRQQTPPAASLQVESTGGAHNSGDGPISRALPLRLSSAVVTIIQSAPDFSAASESDSASTATLYIVGIAIINPLHGLDHSEQGVDTSCDDGAAGWVDNGKGVEAEVQDKELDEGNLVGWPAEAVATPEAWWGIGHRGQE